MHIIRLLTFNLKVLVFTGLVVCFSSSAYAAKIESQILLSIGIANPLDLTDVSSNRNSGDKSTGILIAQAKKPVRKKFQIIDGSSKSGAAESDVDSVPRSIPPLPETGGKSDAARTWDIVSSTTDIAVLDRFIARYPGTIQAALAAQKRGELARAMPTKLPDPVQQIETVAPSTRDLALDIQVELLRLGCQPGGLNGKWRKSSIEAAERFNKFANTESDTDFPNLDLLENVRARQAKVCPDRRDAGKEKPKQPKLGKICKAGQKLSSKGRCYTPKAKKSAKKCRLGQRLSSKGRCYTPRQKITKSCRPGERLSSKGRCYVPKQRSTNYSRKPEPPAKQVRQCRWCETVYGGSEYICGRAKIARECN